ncbi:MAG: glycine dehydrogenase (aminomethyl-transferring) [Planctomycetota bacterium]|nr:MAG: glycine dehydrogenase (aminomethyl-transferring) [Planctomycetota bacterium]
MSAFSHPDRFLHRHIGPRADDRTQMLQQCGFTDLDGLIDTALPSAIRSSLDLSALPPGHDEAATLDALSQHAAANRPWRSYLGLGYANCHTPPVIQRTILENPGWYTQYTPYQAEISQGRLEALATFQTMISDLTGLPIANASLLDEATAAAEAVHLAHGHHRGKRQHVLVDANCHPQVIAVIRTRCQPLGLQVSVAPWQELTPDTSCAIVISAYPGSDGAVADQQSLGQRCQDSGALWAVCCDLLALCLLTPPGKWGADIVCGSAQRFGVPLGGGGPHAAFFAVQEKLKRLLPGRLVGLSRDRHGTPAYRLALQTREQHIRRERATSNICTAQALLANIAAAYAVYHGPEGLRAIAEHVHACAQAVATLAQEQGLSLRHNHFFDTVCIHCDDPQATAEIHKRACEREINLRLEDPHTIVIACDETMRDADIADLAVIVDASSSNLQRLRRDDWAIPENLQRPVDYCQHATFRRYHSEHGLLRWLKELERKDLSLCHSMIPLGSCTMKLNAAAEMLSLTLPGFAAIHPFAPHDQQAGYQALTTELEAWLAHITGLHATSLQPNSGAQGEYAGLLAIRAYHQERGQGQRSICLIPNSAHGTNPASAVMAGMRVVPVSCDQAGNIDIDDLRTKAQAHADDLAALMITYPSTHGVFEEGIIDICAIIHEHGGQVYMDGANLNAQVGLTSPGAVGADVCHLNLHKTFCIPHGGGGPGVGPICVAQHLAPYLPQHANPDHGVGPVSAAPWGSASICTISWAYIHLMGGDGLRQATTNAILNANYLAHRLRQHYPILYSGKRGLVAHECIIDCRPFKRSAGIEVEDIAKRLMDYGFHAPTISWPVPGTMMIEPTESEPREELDRFCEAMIAIRAEIAAIEDGRLQREESPLLYAPHTAHDLIDWDRPYSQQAAAWPLPWVAERKYWPPVGRIDAAYGDRNLFCSCAPVEAMQEEAPAEAASR